MILFRKEKVRESKFIHPFLNFIITINEVVINQLIFKIGIERSIVIKMISTFCFRSIGGLYKPVIGYLSFHLLKQILRKSERRRREMRLNYFLMLLKWQLFSGVQIKWKFIIWWKMKGRIVCN